MRPTGPTLVEVDRGLVGAAELPVRRRHVIRHNDLAVVRLHLERQGLSGEIGPALPVLPPSSQKNLGTKFVEMGVNRMILFSV